MKTQIILNADFGYLRVKYCNATEKMYALLYGFAGLVIAMAYSYSNGTITTLEKRYKIPTKTTGIISVGNDISLCLASPFLGYYMGRGHRPHWMAFGLFTLVVFCLLTASPHFLYGAGDEALKLTKDFGLTNYTDVFLNSTQDDRSLCNDNEPDCVAEVSVWMPIILLFVAQLISGIGCSLFYTLGLTYMDDNTAKSKSPALLSWTSFIRMLGPAIGYSLASFCLRLYIAPDLEPVIKNTDARWLGAWWLGWLILAGFMLISTILIYMFPKELPAARANRLQLEQVNAKAGHHSSVEELTLKNMVKCVKRLAVNKVYVYNTLASVLYFFGYMPYWIFTPKYIETQYKQSASTATMVTGSGALAFSAAGILLSGFVISKYKPSARTMAAWNGISDYLTVAGLLCYVFIGCDGSDNMASLSAASSNCTAACHCDFVQYSPICGQDNVTYISPCHAGCTGQYKDENDRMVFSGCGCIADSNSSKEPQTQIGIDGACPVDCSKQFIAFVAVMCFLKFVGSFGRAGNLLLALRCVSTEDKTFSLGFGNTLLSLVSFIPSPIFFGWLLDSFCLVWGKTCSNKGNCWLYDTKSLRYTLNLTSAGLIFVGAFWNIGVWYYAKDLQIFDEESRKEIQEEIDEFELKETKNDMNT
ncbi:solute carrier organic anion transporter family member 74D-like isoform X2 [Scaptodrosophila lebanonensis]|uniref:Solute carrier organic anion transporter family member n=1 Tax=Drosophila lebanonensis TaxID=7225 RepID=A0A6J2U764_DROLE|nr:solute carrier organic anion transporter family member 74D-like isoform X2 [Scaptodrosophila lebanonensis]